MCNNTSRSYTSSLLGQYADSNARVRQTFQNFSGLDELYEASILFFMEKIREYNKYEKTFFIFIGCA